VTTPLGYVLDFILFTNGVCLFFGFGWKCNYPQPGTAGLFFAQRVLQTRIPYPFQWNLLVSIGKSDAFFIFLRIMQDFSLFVFINRMFNSKCYKENNLCDVSYFFPLSLQFPPQYSAIQWLAGKPWSAQTCGYILRQEAFLTETLLVSI